jgi:N6-L-threonylcarbamoyladenine synthase
MAEKPEYPFLSLIVSGGHSMVVHVPEPFVHQMLGQTRDDAAGEAFDKVAKMLGLGYPGGPKIDKLGAQGNPQAIRFPRSVLEEGSFDFSFSGIKTSVLYYLRNKGWLENPSVIDPHHRADICASFQEAVVDMLVERTMRAARRTGVRDVTIAGGVSANSRLRNRLKEECAHQGFRLFYPKMEYCMDNGAMIAYVGWMKLQRGESSVFDVPAVANLELA